MHAFQCAALLTFTAAVLSWTFIAKAIPWTFIATAISWTFITATFLWTFTDTDLNMKTLPILLLVVALAASQSPDPSVTVRPSGSVTSGGTCSHQSDCEDSLCCVHSSFIGKRRKRLFLDGLFNHDHGTCKPHRKLNETCLPFMTHDIFNHELYESYCPCEQGLECRGVTVDEAEHSVVHHNPRCQPPES